MTIRERVKELCKQQGISVNQFEKEVGVAKGYVSKLDNSTPNGKKIQAMADYLGVSSDYLITGETAEPYYQDEETARIAQEIKDNEELKGLFSAARDASPETLNTIHQMLLIMKRNERHDD